MNQWAAKIREGDARALARAATGVENRDPAALETLRELAPFAGHARIVGITGPPGAGKSTLVDALAAAMRRAGQDGGDHGRGSHQPRHRRRHPGRPHPHAAAPRRPRHLHPLHGHARRLGGLARATADLARLMDAAGKDYVLIETVGVGQDEIEIAGLAQVTVVVLVPGMGDDVQAIKAGIMEIADVFVINKADQPGADRVERELQRHAEPGRWAAGPGHRLCARWPPKERAVDGVARTRCSACPNARAGGRERRCAHDPGPSIISGIAVKSLRAGARVSTKASACTRLIGKR